MFFLMLLVVPSALSLFAQKQFFLKDWDTLGFVLIYLIVDYPNGYNRYEVPFKVTGFPATENFYVYFQMIILQLSLNLALYLTASTTPADTPTDKTLTFEVPADLIGSDTYKLRVESIQVSQVLILNQVIYEHLFLFIFYLIQAILY